MNFSVPVLKTFRRSNLNSFNCAFWLLVVAFDPDIVSAAMGSYRYVVIAWMRNYISWTHHECLYLLCYLMITLPSGPLPRNIEQIVSTEPNYSLEGGD